MTADPALPLSFLGLSATRSTSSPTSSRRRPGARQVGGPHQVLDLASEQLKVTALALALSLAIAFPLGALARAPRQGERLAIAVGNAGRAIPELALIAFMAAVIGVGLGNLTIALSVLGIPPILTNTYVGDQPGGPRSGGRGARDGDDEPEIVRKVEVPLAVPTIMSGVRTATINIVATATIAPLAGVLTLGDFIIARNVYGDEGVLAGAILVALLALSLELILAGVQYMLTSPGLRASGGRDGLDPGNDEGGTSHEQANAASRRVRGIRRAGAGARTRRLRRRRRQQRQHRHRRRRGGKAIVSNPANGKVSLKSARRTSPSSSSSARSTPRRWRRPATRSARTSTSARRRSRSGR